MGYGWGDGVVPLAVEGVRRELHGSQLGIHHLDVGRVLACVEFRLHA